MGDLCTHEVHVYCAFNLYIGDEHTRSVISLYVIRARRSVI